MKPNHLIIYIYIYICFVIIWTGLHINKLKTGQATCHLLYEKASCMNVRKCLVSSNFTALIVRTICNRDIYNINNDH